MEASRQYFSEMFAAGASVGNNYIKTDVEKNHGPIQKQHEKYKFIKIK